MKRDCPRRSRFNSGLTIFLLSVLAPFLAQAQYFGKNRVRYETFDFQILATDHFDVYYYDATAETAELAGRLSERWYSRLSGLLGHELTRRQPLILYASQPDFRQTNTSPADLGEGTGGFTEIFRNRVVMPYAGTLAETDHVIGHELVHAFQFDMTGNRADQAFGAVPGAIRLPLWFAEGMAEYLSLGTAAAHTAMWLRDGVVNDRIPSIRQLNNPRYMPYRWGHAFMAYLGGRFGDEAIGRFLVQAARTENIDRAIQSVFEISPRELSEQWQEAVRNHYLPLVEEASLPDTYGRQLLAGTEGRLPSINLAPALSPDGTRMVYFSERQRVSLELFLMDVRTGERIRRITSAAVDPHLESIQFIRSAGSWSPDGRQFVYTALSRGRPILRIIEAESGALIDEIPLPGIDEALTPKWSPDGQRIALAGQTRGFTDLYVHDLRAGRLERLTNDLYSALQPEWSPDGRYLAFVSDRFTTDLETLDPGLNRLAIMNVETREIEAAPYLEGTTQTNPNWSADGGSIYFIGNLRGTGNVYRIDLAEQRIYELTNVKTGVSGITQLSPALSVAGPNDTMAFTVFDGGGYAVYLSENAAAVRGTPAEEIFARPEYTLLPPLDRSDEHIVRYLAQPELGLDPDPVIDTRPYRTQIRPEFISQAQLAGGTSAFGTVVGAGTSLFWSDMLGNHNVVTQVEAAYADGEFLRNLGAVLAYQNREGRMDWGGALSHVPLTSASFQEGFAMIDDDVVFVQEVVRFRELNREISGGAAFPFSRSHRVEFYGGARNISFDINRQLRVFSPETGQLILDERQDIPAPSSITLGSASAAYVIDTSLFGGTAPILGQRARFELSGLAGDLNFLSPLVDYRTYWMPFNEFPLTVAGRLMHFGRYGSDAEDPRVGAVFLGSPSLVRGYEFGFTTFGDPNFPRLQGSRIAVGNVELRLPLTGFRGYLGGTYLPPIELATFYDVGAAWTRGNRPNFLGGDRSPVASYGASLRTNLGGIFVLQLSFVNPVNLPARGWHWQFSLTPGF